MSSRALKRRSGVKKRRGIAGVLSIVAILFSFVLASVIGIRLVVGSWFEDLPDYQSANAFNMAMPTYVYANDHETVIARFQMEYRVPVEMDQISPLFKNAMIAIEDARYYEHSGIDYYGVARALVNNLTGGSLEGASTITQQFVRNTILSNEMDDISIRRKVREAYIAVELEKMYSKDDVLQMYLNTVNFGAGAYGVEAASLRYFSKHASELTLPEAALLAGIPQSPTYNDPMQYPDQAIKRRNLVLGRMLAEHMITQEEYDEAVVAPLELNPQDIADDGILAYPYFTSYVRSLLYNEFDLSEADILKGGLKVYTTLDIDKQKIAEEAAQWKRERLYDDGLEVAIAIVDPDTGNVEAIVGGSNYDESQVNLATGQGGGGRPCGSAFKAFTLVEAIKQGIDPDSTYVDCSSPSTIDGYTLENYDNISYGTRTITGAIAVSANTGFVRLVSSIGVTNVANTARDLGITSNLNEETAGATLTLGVENVTPLEMANSFATIANGGVRHDLCAVTSIEDREGNVIVDNTNPEARATRVITPEVAHAAQESLKSVVKYGTGTAAAMGNGQPVAGKTGTSESYKDITFTGMTPHIVASIWIGDPSNENSVPSGTTCADVFKVYATDIMEAEAMRVEDFPQENNPAYEPYSDAHYQITSGYSSYGYGYGNGYGYGYGYGNSDGSSTNPYGYGTDGTNPYGYGTDGTGTYGYGYGNGTDGTGTYGYGYGTDGTGTYGYGTGGTGTYGYGYGTDGTGTYGYGYGTDGTGTYGYGADGTGGYGYGYGTGGYGDGSAYYYDGTG